THKNSTLIAAFRKRSTRQAAAAYTSLLDGALDRLFDELGRLLSGQDHQAVAARLRFRRNLQLDRFRRLLRDLYLDVVLAVRQVHFLDELHVQVLPADSQFVSGLSIPRIDALHAGRLLGERPSAQHHHTNHQAKPISHRRPPYSNFLLDILFRGGRKSKCRKLPPRLDPGSEARHPPVRRSVAQGQAGVWRGPPDSEPCAPTAPNNSSPKARWLSAPAWASSARPRSPSSMPRPASTGPLSTP